QAFLLAAAFNPLIDRNVSLILAGFSLIAGIASIQLMAKHRYFEMVDSELLMNFERANAAKGFDILHGPHRPVDGVQANWFVRIKSFRGWIVVLSGFCALALIALYSAA